MGDAKKIAPAISPISALTNGSLFGQKQIQPQAYNPLNPAFQPLANDLGAYARSYVGRGATPYTGSFVSPLSGGESDILSAINRLALPVGGDGGDTPPLGNLAFGGERSSLISDILSGRNLSPTSNPYLASTLDYMRDQAGRTLGTNMNLLDAAFGKAGMGSSSDRSRQAIELGRQSGADTNNAIASILGNQYNQGIQNQMTTLGSILPNMDAYTSTMLFNALGANALPRTIAQTGLNADYQDFLRRLNEPLQYTQMASSILNGSPQMQYMMPQYAPSQFQQILGGASQVGQAILPFALM